MPQPVRIPLDLLLEPTIDDNNQIQESIVEILQSIQQPEPRTQPARQVKSKYRGFG